METTTFGITFVLELRLRSESFLCSSLLFLRYPLEDKTNIKHFQYPLEDKTKRLIETSLIIHRKIRQNTNTSFDMSPRIVWGFGLDYSLLTWTWQRRRGWWRRRCRWKRWTRTWTMRRWNLLKLSAPYLTPLTTGPICFFFFCHVIPRKKWCQTILGKVSLFSRSRSLLSNLCVIESI